MHNIITVVGTLYRNSKEETHISSILRRFRLRATTTACERGGRVGEQVPALARRLLVARPSGRPPCAAILEDPLLAAARPALRISYRPAFLYETPFTAVSCQTSE